MENLFYRIEIEIGLSDEIEQSIPKDGDGEHEFAAVHTGQIQRATEKMLASIVQDLTNLGYTTKISFGL